MLLRCVSVRTIQIVSTVIIRCDRFPFCMCPCRDEPGSGTPDKCSIEIVVCAASVASSNLHMCPHNFKHWRRGMLGSIKLLRFI